MSFLRSLFTANLLAKFFSFAGLIKFFRSLFTEHLLAKFFALVFAAATIYLVDRELRIEWYDVSMDIVTGDESREGSSPYVVLRTAPNIWVHPDDLEKTIRLTIEGPEKNLAVFRRNPAVQLNILDSWAKKGGSGETKHVLVDADFSLPRFPGVEISVESDVVIRVDRFVEVENVRVEYAQTPKLLSVGILFDPSLTKIEPSHLSVRGPRQYVSGLGGELGAALPLRLALGDKAQYRPGSSYDALPADGFSRNQVTFSNRDFVKVTLGARTDEIVSLVLGAFDVTLALDYPSYEAIQDKKVLLAIEAQLSQKVKVTLEGPKSRVSPYQSLEAQKRLRKRLRVIVDPTSFVNDVAGGLTPPTQLDVRLIAIDGLLPEGLRVKELDPNPISITIKKQTTQH
ncbi:MAG: hypothetical protein V3W41_21530 [Planctomycetota bacterium]